MIICELIDLIGGVLAAVGLFRVPVLGNVVEEFLYFFQDVFRCVT